jgi:hypothetical protein
MHEGQSENKFAMRFWGFFIFNSKKRSSGIILCLSNQRVALPTVIMNLPDVLTVGLDYLITKMYAM